MLIRSACRGVLFPHVLSLLCGFGWGGDSCKKSQAAASGQVPTPCLAQDWTSRPANASAARALGVIMCLSDKCGSLATPQTVIVFNLHVLKS